MIARKRRKRRQREFLVHLEISLSELLVVTANLSLGVLTDVH